MSEKIILVRDINLYDFNNNTILNFKAGEEIGSTHSFYQKLKDKNKAPALTHVFDNTDNSKLEKKNSELEDKNAKLENLILAQKNYLEAINNKVEEKVLSDLKKIVKDAEKAIK